jgi:hypothetical protein
MITARSGPPHPFCFAAPPAARCIRCVSPRRPRPAASVAFRRAVRCILFRSVPFRFSAARRPLHPLRFAAPSAASRSVPFRRRPPCPFRFAAPPAYPVPLRLPGVDISDIL